MKSKVTGTNSTKMTKGLYDAIDSATMPISGTPENYTSNVTDYNEGHSGLDMLEQQPKPLLLRNQNGKQSLRIDVPSNHNFSSNYIDMRDKSPITNQSAVSNQLDLSQYTDTNDALKNEILRQIKELENNVDWQIYDA